MYFFFLKQHLGAGMSEYIVGNTKRYQVDYILIFNLMFCTQKMFETICHNEIQNIVPTKPVAADPYGLIRYLIL